MDDRVFCEAVAVLGRGIGDNRNATDEAQRLDGHELGIAVLGFGCALYIGAHMGAGPRDSLMVGLHRRAGISIGAARAASHSP